MNETIQLLLQHRSIRKFTREPVSGEQFSAIMSAAQMASSSSNVQAYSVVVVRDESRKRELSVLGGHQQYIAECPVFLVWCADLHRLRLAYSMHGDPNQAYLDTTENMLVAIIDASLAAQNAAVAAESLGLGIVYIGGIRNRIEEVSELLKLPDRVVPLFGMCVGHPDQDPVQRPRLPVRAVVHDEEYSDGHMLKTIQQYDQTMKQYIIERTEGKRTNTWSEDMFTKFSAHARPHMRSFLKDKQMGIDPYGN